MSLQLNDTVEPYKAFEGRNIDTMPALLKEGRTPLSMRCVMEQRLHALESGNTGLQKGWVGNYFDTGGGILYHPDGKIKIVLDAQPLRDLNPQSLLKEGALVLEEGVYETLDGVEFSAQDREHYARGTPLTQEDVVANPIWRALARDDQSFLQAYAGKIFDVAQERWERTEDMGIYVSPTQKVPTLRAWLLGDPYSSLNSGADGSNSLVSGSGRFVGVAPEALNQQERNAESMLESRVKTAMDKDEAVLSPKGTLYVPVRQDANVKLEQ